MELDDLIRTFPRVHHMAHADSWDEIRRHGLLSTTALLDLFEIQEPERARIRSRRRPESVSSSIAFTAKPSFVTTNRLMTKVFRDA